MELSDIDLIDSRNFVAAVPHQWFAELRRQAPVYWHEETDGPGFWCVTKYDDCVAVNRDYEHFSSAKQATFIWDMPEEQLEQQRLMMLNMDPPLHTRYRRLVNKGFTPRMVISARGEDPPDGRRHHRRRHREGRGRLRHRHLRRAPPAGHRRSPRRAPGGPPQHVRLVQPDDRAGGPRVSRTDADDAEYAERGGHGALRLRRRALRQEAARTPPRTS